MRVPGLLFCLAVFAVRGTADTPSISTTALRLGGSPVVPVHAWAELKWQVENPLDQPFTGALRLSPADRAGDIVEKVIRMPARTRLAGRLPIPTGSGENYRVELLVGGRPVSHDTTPVRRIQTLDTVFLVGAAPVDLGIANLRPKLGRGFRVRFVRVRSEDFPETWELLQSVRLVGILRPDWSKYSARQLNALKSYAASGGTVVFLSPRGAIETLGTPLEELLPVAPLAVRPIDTPTCFARWGLADGTRPDRPLWPDGRDFLESVPVGSGVTTLVQGAFPVCRWRRFGLGATGMTAFLPFGPGLDRAGYLIPLWRHLLSWSNGPPVLECHDRVPGGLERALDLLTGYPTPGVGQVTLVLVGYLLTVGLLLFAGRRLGRPGWGLCGAATLGALTAVGIVWIGYRRAGHRPSRSVATLGLRSTAAGRLFYQGAASLFSKTDTRVNIRSASPEVHFRRVGAEVERGVFRTRVGTRGLAAVPNLKLRALRPRRLCMAFAGPAEEKAPEKPLLRIGPAGPFLDPTRNGADMVTRAAAAWLCFGGAGVRPAGQSTRGISGAAGLTSGVSLNRLAIEAERLLSNLSVSGIWLAALVPGGGRSSTRAYLQFPADFVRSEWRIELVPASVEIASGVIQVPPEMIRVEAGSRFSRTQLGERRPWRETRLMGDWTYTFDAVLPPFTADIRPDRIEVDLDISNPGENVRGSVFLLPRDLAASPEKNDVPPDSIGPVRTQGARFVFDGKAAARALDPSTGRLVLMLRCTQKKAVSSAVDIQRLNRWRLIAFQVRVFGRLPDAPTPRRL
ncbi:MAG: hypothetical protein GXP31_06290 [Kiritimatiellaeota bacterium]|nr:hypothetical protein [Kiritimatiellota bacterium]